MFGAAAVSVALCVGGFFPSRQLSFKTVGAPSFVFFRCVLCQIRRKAPARGKYPAPRKKAGGVTLCAAASLSRHLEDICMIYTEKNKTCFSGGEVSPFVLFCCGTMKLSWENVRSIKDEVTHTLSVSLFVRRLKMENNGWNKKPLLFQASFLKYFFSL